MSEYNPFSAPPPFDDPAFDDPASEVAAQRVYGGIGRLAYFGLSILIGIASNVLTSIIVGLSTPGQSQSVGLVAVAVVGLLNLTASVTVIVLRLKNLGMNGFWVLGLIVPILNLVIAVRLVAAPEGYADHKTLDTPGKWIVGIFIGLFVLALVIVAIAVSR
jgi:uncharacterized membrane protein YhaH (DUF805 family)